MTPPDPTLDPANPATPGVPAAIAMPGVPVAPAAPAAPAAVSEPRHASASSAIVDVLIGPSRPVRVLAAFPAAVYLAHDERIVTLVAADGIHHPNAIVVAAPTADRPLVGTYPEQRGTVGRGKVELGSLTVTITRWFDPFPRLPATTADALRSAVSELETLLLAWTGFLPVALAAPAGDVAAALRDGDAGAVVEAAHHLIGSGPGLTPAGDDVLAGLFAAVRTLAPGSDLSATIDRAAPATLERARRATTAVSAELLRHAVRGEVAAPATGMLQALAGRRSLGPALDRLLAVGATSGRDLTYGITVGARLVAAAPQPTPVATRPPEPVGDPR